MLPDEDDKKPDELLSTLDDPFGEEETTSPDHKKATVICPACNGKESAMTCDTCWGKLRIDKETYDRWRRRK